MKIGFLYRPYYPVTSSSSVHGYEIAKGLVKRGHTLLSYLDDKNPDVISYPPNKFGAIRMAMDSDILYIRAVEYLEHCSLLKLVKPFSLPVVWEINAPVEEYYAIFPNDTKIDKKVKSLNRRRNFLAKFVDASICVSEILKNYSQNFLRIRDSYYVSNGSDLDVFSEGKHRETFLDNLNEYYKVFWVGNPNFKWQGIDIIFEIAKKMYTIDKKVLFVFISTPSSVRFPVTNNVLALGQVNYLDLPNYLFSADLCLCLYKNYDWCKYGFYNSPLKLFDYMSAGKPIIATDMGQISTVIKNDSNGLLTDNNIEHIINKILELKKSPESAAQLGKNARQSVVDYFNWDRTVEQIEQVLVSKLKK